MMGAPGDGPSIPKEQLVDVITSIHRQMLRRLLEEKRRAITERIEFYKVNAEAYRDCIAAAMQRQQEMFQEIIIEVLAQLNVPMESFGNAMRSHMMDPEVQEKFSLMQTASLDMCEGQPIPEELDKNKFIEVITFQTEEMMKYPVKDMESSIMAQTAAADEVFQVFGFDEIQLAAAAIRLEDDPDPVLVDAKEKWNNATRNPIFMDGPAGAFAGGPSVEELDPSS